MKSSHAIALLAAACIGSASAQTTADLWDLSQGTVVTASSGPIPGYAIESMFGGFSIVDWAYFSDSQPPGFVHFAEWETLEEVTVGQIKLYALGDAVFGFPNNQREFSRVVLRAKSPGATVYDQVLVDYTPTHPYTFAGPFNLLLDQTVSPVVSKSFRAEFTQFDTDGPFDGPRIIELDAFPPLPPPPPVVTTQPEANYVNIGMPAQFSVAASGSGTISYQWFKDGTPVTGQTSSTYRIPIVATTDMGTYSVRVTDANGSAMSDPAALTIEFFNAVESQADVWDVKAGATITSHSDLNPFEGTIDGMFGGLSWGYTVFADNMPTGTVHSVEWTPASPVTLNAVRLWAYGHGWANNSREFATVTLKAKTPGSTSFNVTLGTFTSTHPYTFLDGPLIWDVRVNPVLANAFRAEFLQYDAGQGMDGPLILELDGFEGRPLLRPVVVVGPDSRTVPKNSPVRWKVIARGGDLTYQWKFMGQPIQGATTDTLELRHIKAKDQGYYSVAVTNPAGSVESAAALLLVSP
jgi:hypothetical protein